MQSATAQPANEPAWIAVEDLSPATIEGVADRLLGAHGFVELVYRETEMDALFSLADIAIHTARAMPQSSTISAADRDLVVVRNLIFQAHDLAHEGCTTEAAQLLREAARHMEFASGPSS